VVGDEDGDLTGAQGPVARRVAERGAKAEDPRGRLRASSRQQCVVLRGQPGWLPLERDALGGHASI
jgi:hypothetical protein